jgi:hypothetical protein
MENNGNLSSFGFCTWNVWGDDTVDRPDNVDETIIATMVQWLVENGFGVKFCQFQTMNDTDTFSGPEASIRRFAYDAMVQCIDEYPSLDYLLVRWRWNLGIENDERLLRQSSAIEHYVGTNTKIFIWDEDFKMSQAERNSIFGGAKNVSYIEISEVAKEDDSLIHVPVPLKIDRKKSLLRVLDKAGSGAGDHLDANLSLAYVGNNYDREEFVQRYIEPVARMLPGKVHVYGNWLKKDLSVSARMPNICYHPKASKSLCDWLYQHATAVPMLAKQIYFDKGHITPRMYEVVSSGGIPIGFSDFLHAEQYFRVIVSSAEELYEKVKELEALSRFQRLKILHEQLEILEKNKVFDVNAFFSSLGVFK